ncbi:AAA family ATPase [Halobacterium litoreum]|uniref:Replication factor C small subunit n=1 Tax=Halobacterium litoreum TaxID=2039234 RepID=A0ABD5NF80_9EURY|nr:AAA family ATPase [Halobacterium litoreum]UHH13164.1 AAA family ATPase [Halobacterium litoreum]
MDAPLWTDTHAPTLADLPQADVRDRLRDAVDEPVNLVVYGPEGAGKTAAVRALADEAHADPENDLVELNVADFFGMTKKEVSEDPRFASFIDSKRRRNSSKADLINHVLKESASYPPVSGDYNTIVLDNAEAIREDFQQALRRVMERHHEATQFVITTRQPSKLIPPIHSRCFPVSVRAPTPDETVAVLRDIVEAEGVDHDEDGLEFVAGYAEGNLRKAILGAQTTAEQAGEVTMNAAYETLQDVGADDAVESMLDDAEAGDFTDARKTLDDLLVDEGMDGEEVLRELLDVGRSRYSGDELAQLHRLAGDVEFDLTQGNSDRIQLGRLLAEFGR